MSKGELNRLGDRLVASVSPSEADLGLLARALATYQNTLELVKADLRGLGFSPSGRVKTTKTMIEKLQRTPGMDLSRVQDLAGARITVRGFKEQDKCRDEVAEFYRNRGHDCKVIDRRVDPRYGYRAVHLVPRVGQIQVEIQIRTELQDSWAQIFERLADRWGRGIRYGKDPENPEFRVRSGKTSYSRRESVDSLMKLSDSIFELEDIRQKIENADQNKREIDIKVSEFLGSHGPEVLNASLQPDMIEHNTEIANYIVESYGQLIDAECREILDRGDNVTFAQSIRLAQLLSDYLAQGLGRIAGRRATAEQDVRARLSVVANTEDEEE